MTTQIDEDDEHEEDGDEDDEHEDDGEHEEDGDEGDECVITCGIKFLVSPVYNEESVVRLPSALLQNKVKLCKTAIPLKGVTVNWKLNDLNYLGAMENWSVYI